MSMLGALAGLQLSMDKSSYRVGEKPLYQISGAPAGAQIAWTSYKNGEATGEYQAFYGQYTDQYGNAQIAAVQPWGAENVGSWRKDVIVIPKDYPASPLGNDTVTFTVLPAGAVGASTGTGTGATSAGGSDSGIGSIFSGDVEVFGTQIPKIALIGGGLVALFLVAGGGSGGGRR